MHSRNVCELVFVLVGLSWKVTWKDTEAGLCIVICDLCNQPCWMVCRSCLCSSWKVEEGSRRTPAPRVQTWMFFPIWAWEEKEEGEEEEKKIEQSTEETKDLTCLVAGT